MKAITKRQLGNEDWKTQLARGYNNIPEGAEVKVIDPHYVNFYGVFARVFYEGNSYYVNPKDIKIIAE